MKDLTKAMTQADLDVREHSMNHGQIIKPKLHIRGLPSPSHKSKP